MTEYVDVLDENGRKTGEIKERSAVHRDGDWHRAVMVFVLNGDQVLLQRRSLEKETGAGMLDLSYAGHVMAGDDALSTAVREGREELGLMIKADELLHLGEVKVQTRRCKAGGFQHSDSVTSTGTSDDHGESKGKRSVEYHGDVASTVTSGARFPHSEAWLLHSHFYDVYVWHTTAPAEKMILQKEEVSEVFYLPIAKFLEMVKNREPELCPHPEVYGVFEEYLRANAAQ